MTKWDYRVIHDPSGQMLIGAMADDDPDAETRAERTGGQELEQLGEQGWELAAGASGFLVFKRPKE